MAVPKFSQISNSKITWTTTAHLATSPPSGWTCANWAPNRCARSANRYALHATCITNPVSEYTGPYHAAMHFAIAVWAKRPRECGAAWMTRIRPTRALQVWSRVAHGLTVALRDRICLLPWAAQSAPRKRPWPKSDYEWLSSGYMRPEYKCPVGTWQ